MSFKRDIKEINKKNEELKNSIFTDAQMVTVLWLTKPEIIGKILPPPLEPAEKPLVSVFIAYYPKTNQGQPYYESALFIRAKFKGTYGNYFLAMHVTDDRAMIGGREIAGFPKKMANVFLKRKDKIIEGISERLGTKNLEMKVKLTGKFNDTITPTIIKDLKIIPSRKVGSVSYNFKYFTSPDRKGFDYNPKLVKQETLFDTKSMEMGEAEIILGSSIHDPWGEVEVVKVLGALCLTGTNTMLPGEVVAEVEPDKFLPYAFIKMDWY